MATAPWGDWVLHSQEDSHTQKADAPGFVFYKCSSLLATGGLTPGARCGHEPTVRNDGEGAHHSHEEQRCESEVSTYPMCQMCSCVSQTHPHVGWNLVHRFGQWTVSKIDTCHFQVKAAKASRPQHPSLLLPQRLRHGMSSTSASAWVPE